MCCFGGACNALPSMLQDTQYNQPLVDFVPRPSGRLLDAALDVAVVGVLPPPPLSQLALQSVQTVLQHLHTSPHHAPGEAVDLLS